MADNPSIWEDNPYDEIGKGTVAAARATVSSLVKNARESGPLIQATTVALPAAVGYGLVKTKFGFGPEFGCPDRARSLEGNTSNLCDLCGEPLASEDDVYVILHRRSEWDAEIDLTPPTSISKDSLVHGGHQHLACSRMTLAWCPYIRPGLMPGGALTADGKHRAQYWLARVPLQTWVESKRDAAGIPIDLREFDFADDEAEKALEAQARKQQAIDDKWFAADAELDDLFSGDVDLDLLHSEDDELPEQVEQPTTEGWDAFPKGLPRPLWQGQPIPWNTIAKTERWIAPGTSLPELFY